ncbi:MAG: DUF4065 domain-containing protein [Gammaproteobacteria bacterium]|nr:DUF4065 domain-containing protein [Gammaproteobacteria bacterium]MCY4283114.1 DUF4065 domain-containing protein [Gammaproteobacteria bacterium]MCY4337603.1 DUF4065 domain-containing protein [Gammaproteobacteria bacterium]
MAIHIFQAAKYAGAYTDWSKSNLELQKIIYIAHMLHIGRSDGPLVDGLFQAWHLGPVHPDLYHRAKVFGADPVRNIFRTFDVDESASEIVSLSDTLKTVSDYSGSKLVAITHWEQGAWYKNYIPGEKHTIIPNSDIREEYENRVARAQSGR